MKTIIITITNPYDEDGNLTKEFHISDTGGDWDDETCRSYSDVLDLKDERKEYYINLGFDIEVESDYIIT